MVLPKPRSLQICTANIKPDGLGKNLCKTTFSPHQCRVSYTKSLRTPQEAPSWQPARLCAVLSLTMASSVKAGIYWGLPFSDTVILNYPTMMSGVHKNSFTLVDEALSAIV